MQVGRGLQIDAKFVFKNNKIGLIFFKNITELIAIACSRGLGDKEIIEMCCPI